MEWPSSSTALCPAAVTFTPTRRTDHLLDDVQRDGLHLGRLVRARELKGPEVAVAVGVLHRAAAVGAGDAARAVVAQLRKRRRPSRI
jgi:hypothetical protein